MTKEVNLCPTFNTSRWSGPCSYSRSQAGRSNSVEYGQSDTSHPPSGQPRLTVSLIIHMSRQGPRRRHGTVGLKPPKSLSFQSSYAQFTSYPIPLKLKSSKGLQPKNYVSLGPYQSGPKVAYVGLTFHGLLKRNYWNSTSSKTKFRTSESGNLNHMDP